MTDVFQVHNTVQTHQIDYNEHFHDSSYHDVFSQAIDAWFAHLGLTQTKRTACEFTVFTLEAHISYLKEITLGTDYTISLYIYNYDAKRTHLFLTMTNADGDYVATYEAMMMGISQTARRSAPFPNDVIDNISTYAEAQPDIPEQQRIGRVMHIPDKRG